MESVKDNEKNRAKVEKKFNVEELEGIVDKEGLAMLFNSGEIVGKSKSKRKEEELSCLVKYSLINMLKCLVDFCVCKSYFKNVVNSGATCGKILNYKNT